MAIRTCIVRVGNSRGVPIPKPLLELTGPAAPDEVEVCAEADHLVTRPLAGARAGWAERFEQMAALGDDHLLDAETSAVSSWDDEEWTW
jgi:antitoxin MazE